MNFKHSGVLISVLGYWARPAEKPDAQQVSFAFAAKQFIAFCAEFSFVRYKVGSYITQHNDSILGHICPHNKLIKILDISERNKYSHKVVSVRLGPVVAVGLARAQRSPNYSSCSSSKSGIPARLVSSRTKKLINAVLQVTLNRVLLLLLLSYGVYLPITFHILLLIILDGIFCR